MRCASLIICTAMLLTAAADPQRPGFILREVVERNWGIPASADWRRERLIDGIGWQLGTVSRGDGSVMQGGYSVIHPTGKTPFALRHCYVLAAFDLLPSGYLLVTVRDPEYYWPGYDYREGVTDPVELVWFSKEWQEEDRSQLDFSTHDFPDGFTMAPDQQTLLAICHPVDADGEPASEGHKLASVDLRTAAVRDVLLPEMADTGAAPLLWWPLHMQWDLDGILIVQAGKQLRLYEVRW